MLRLATEGSTRAAGGVLTVAAIQRLVLLAVIIGTRVGCLWWRWVRRNRLGCRWGGGGRHECRLRLHVLGVPHAVFLI